MRPDPGRGGADGVGAGAHVVHAHAPRALGGGEGGDRRGGGVARGGRGRGAVVTVSSVAGLRYIGYPHLSYSVSKAALIQFTRMIAQQYAGSGIRANCVVPGLIDTPRIAHTVAKQFSADSLDDARAARARQVPMQRMGTAWDVAHACAFLASDAAAYITGTELVVDGGITGKYA